MTSLRGMLHTSTIARVAFIWTLCLLLLTCLWCVVFQVFWGQRHTSPAMCTWFCKQYLIDLMSVENRGQIICKFDSLVSKIDVFTIMSLCCSLFSHPIRSARENLYTSQRSNEASIPERIVCRGVKRIIARMHQFWQVCKSILHHGHTLLPRTDHHMEYLQNIPASSDDEGNSHQVPYPYAPLCAWMLQCCQSSPLPQLDCTCARGFSLHFQVSLCWLANTASLLYWCPGSNWPEEEMGICMYALATHSSRIQNACGGCCSL